MQRLTGVDVARGLALFGMMATHVFDTFTDDNTVSGVTVVAAGRSAATFALLAGVSLAFLSGGRTAVRGGERRAVSAGLVVRAALIGAVGLALGSLGSDIDLILAFYALLFLLAIPLLGLSPKVLVALAAVLVAVGPVLLVAAAAAGVEFGERDDPTLVSLVTEPLGVLSQLLVTGEYPVVLYLAYLCVGLAVGRLDLGSARLAWWLLGVGLAMALTARAVSSVLLHQLGGLDRLVEQSGVRGDAAWVRTSLLWDADQGDSWWYLALAAPHSHTQLDLLHTVGSALAVLGASLLVTRVAGVQRLLAPLAAAGAITLTLYSAHVVVLWTEVLHKQMRLQYVLLVMGSLVLAVHWRRRHRHGPLEGVVTALSTRARRAVLARDGAAVAANR